MKAELDEAKNQIKLLGEMLKLADALRNRNNEQKETGHEHERTKGT